MSDLTRGLLVAECGCKKVDLIDHLLNASDEQVSKALMVSDVAKIARLEIRAQRLLLDKWKVRAKAAADTAGRIVANGKNASKASAAVNVIMQRWDTDVGKQYSGLIVKAYKLARKAGHDKATGKTKGSLQYRIPDTSKVKKATKDPTASISLQFGLADDKAIAQLSSQEMMWIGEVYENVAPTVNSAIVAAIQKGLSAADAGTAVAAAVASALGQIAIPNGYNGSAASYFEALAANAITNVRVQGQITSFASLGVPSYEIVNPDDERTTELCHELNGTVFTTEDAVSNMEELAKAETPAEYRAAKPFLPTAEILQLLDEGANVLAQAGQAFPPYHMNCRSTVDVSEESMDFDSLSDD